MSEELREYYERELSYFRSLGAEFADRYKKIAARLQLGPTESKDPHVERLLQGMALLTARVRRKLDDDYPELAEALFSVVYPHYLRPVPSLAMIQFVLERSQAELFGGHEIKIGTRLETIARPLDQPEEVCAYRTCYPLRVWPIKVEAAALKSRPFVAPRTSLPGVRGIVHLKLKTLSPKANFRDLKVPTLRFYLHAGAQQINVFKLYELIMQNSLGVAIASTENAERPVVLDKSCLQAVGFAPEESLLPHDARTFAGYRLMTEYFALPEKHLFIDIAGLTPQHLAQLGETAELFIYLSRSDADLERYVSADTFRLGVTPVINLFEQSCAPIELTHQQTEYLLLPDVNRKSALEIYSVNHVEVVGDGLKGSPHLPFYSFKHAAAGQAAKNFHHATWREAADGARDVYLSVVDLDFQPSQTKATTLRAQATCLNRNLPGSLGHPPAFQLEGGRGVMAEINCLTQPTSTQRPPLKNRNLWRLVSHLSLNHLSLVEEADAAHALREILTLYNFNDRQEMHTLIESIVKVNSQRVIRRVGQRSGGFGQGVQVEIDFDESNLAGQGAYLFASVIDRFLALYVSINSFTELVARSRQRIGQEDPWKWPKRTGHRVLV